MEALRLKPRQPAEREPEVENWDDDDFFVDDGDDLTFRSSMNSNNQPASRRDSISSHRSMRSELESLQGEEQQVHVPGDDETSTMDAIVYAAGMGIPLPKNVPSSALMGGTIKRLGGRKVRRAIEDDWDADLEFPESGKPLAIKPQDGSRFPDAIRQVSDGSVQMSPTDFKKQPAPVAHQDAFDHSQSRPSTSGTSVNLDKFRDDEDDDDFFGDGGATIKVSKMQGRGEDVDDIFGDGAATLKAPKLQARGDDFDDIFGDGEATPLQMPKSQGRGEDDDFFGDGTATLKRPKLRARGDNFDDLFGDGAATSKAPKPQARGDNFDDFFGDGSSTIKVSKNQGRGRPMLLTPPTPQKEQKAQPPDDDLEQDFELPSDGKLKLSTRKDIPKTPALGFDDVDWGEGSIGTRYGGTRRDGRSNRSSFASALSPSISSSITAESEDETFDGLVLPPGPVNFEHRLKLHSKRSRSPQRVIEEEPSPQPKKLPEAEEEKEDFCAGLDLGDAGDFDSRKFAFHRNIKLKDARPDSPSRPKTSASITFTNKPVSHQPSRLPRLSHERTQSSLEPVSESGGPFIPRLRRSQSRIGHSAHSSLSSLPTSTTSPSAQSVLPSTPRRQPREISSKASAPSLRNEPTTTNAQLLRLKRSMPAMKAPSPPKVAAGRFERPPSRTETGRPLSGLRPKTPVERTRQDAGSSTLPRRHPPPFLPAGSSQPHHIKGGRNFRRHDSENSIDFRPSSRNVSGSAMRSPSPRRMRANERLADTNFRLLNKPRHKRTFGSGNELEGFDDLPISRDTESQFMKQPVAKEPRPGLKNKLHQNVLPDRSSPSPVSPSYPAKADYKPSFARDTAASRIARETALAQRGPTQGPLAPLTAQRVAQLSTRNNLIPNAPHSSTRSKKHKRQPQLKPHLISNLSSARDTKTINGMVYNPATFRWEGNENALSAFDPPASPPSTSPMSPYAVREKENATPRPALITNISSTKGVQVVGEMVFDPQNMCWLKLGAPHKAASETTDPLDGFNALDDDDDVFRDIPDLEEATADSNDGGQGRASDMRDDWLVGEEFDVGPEFIRRQREEEERWRKKCESWLSGSSRDHEAWRWTIRELISGDAGF